MVRILESNQSDIFTNKTDISYYDDMMSDEKCKGDATNREYYKFEKGKDWHIVYMTADKYMQMISKYVFDGRDSYRGVTQDNVDKYADMMKKGVKFPLPYIDITEYSGQEGRHRMLAGAKAFGEDAKFPVMLIFDTKATEQEIEDYVDKAYPNYRDFGLNYVKGCLNM